MHKPPETDTAAGSWGAFWTAVLKAHADLTSSSPDSEKPTEE